MACAIGETPCGFKACAHDLAIAGDLASQDGIIREADWGRGAGWINTGIGLTDAAVGCTVGDLGVAAFVACVKFIAQTDGLSFDFGGDARRVIRGTEFNHGHAVDG